MSISVQDVIVGAFLDANLVAAGETPNSSELSDALLRLNQLVASLNAEGAVCWENRSDIKALTGGAGSFTMGPSGALVTDRPTKILAARCYTTGYGRGLRIITDPNDWTAIVERDSALTLPLKLYVDYDYPNVTLHFWPAPTVAAALVINTQEIFATMAPDTPPALQSVAAQPSFIRRTKTFTLANGVGDYTLGPSGTFVASRPMQVVSAHVGFGAYGHDVELISAAEWSSLIEAEDAGIVLPLVLYPQFGYPNATMNFWPVPGSSVTAELHSPRQIAAFSVLSTTVDLPPGQERMLRLGLAVDLYPQYVRGRGIPQELVGLAADAKASVIAANVASGVFQISPQGKAMAQQQAAPVQQ